MRVLIDTREQNPLEFSLEKVGIALKVGDYQAEYSDGSRSTVVFERKSLGDLFGTMTTGYKRFRREMELAKSLGLKLVLGLEDSFAKVEQGYVYSEYMGSSMLKKLGTLYHRYGLDTVFAGSREELSKYIVWRFESEGYERARSGKILKN